MSEILFLAHRIPYPPHKGDKIRSWHFLRGLSKRFTVHLGTFVDDQDDWQHVGTLREICGEVCVRPLVPRMARLRSLAGLARGRALTIDYYRDEHLSAWVRDLARKRPLAGVFVYSSSMAQYAAQLTFPASVPRILDLCDVDSDKWRQYASGRTGPLRWLYAREGRLLEIAERHYAGQFDWTLVIADVEAELMRRIAPEASDRIRVLPNGVDTEYFNPERVWPCPFPAGSRPVVFTGAMDYHPNVDGVKWCAAEVLPRVRAQVPEASFWIVGSNPADEVRALGRSGDVTVTGRVPDVRPYLAHAAVVVAPLRIARGVQNKVLEAMAMARPVVSTPQAAQGLGASTAALTIESDPQAFADGVVKILTRPAQRAVTEARRLAKDHFCWDTNVRLLADLLAPPQGGQPRMMRREAGLRA
jgi:sugar transferase (PEP-CTERM/EpsH1 system associated)